MAKLFGIDLPAVFSRVMGKGALPATLTLVDPGYLPPSQLTGPPQERTSDHAARGLVNEYDEKQVDGTIIQRGDRVVTLYAGSISGRVVPRQNDRVTIDGGTYRIIAVCSGAGRATYECQSRRV